MQNHSQGIISITSLNSMSVGYIEDWFAPFMYKWLAKLSEKTIVWVEEAIKADPFEPAADTKRGEIPSHSSSITDVFSAIYSELELINNLQWSDPVQNAEFFSAFSKVLLPI